MTIRSIRRVFWTLTFTLWLPIGFLLPILVLTGVERGFSITEIGAVFTAYAVTTALLELPTGGLADALGRRPVLIVAAVLQAGMAFAWFMSSTLALFMLGGVVGGVSRALSSGPLEAWFVDSTHEIDGDAPIRPALARAEVAGALSLVAGSLSVTAITFLPGIAADGAVYSTIRLPALLAVIGAILNAGAIAVFMEEHRGIHGGVGTAIREVPIVIRRAARTTGRHETIRLLMVATVLVGVGYSAVEFLYQPLFRDLVGSTASAARLFGVMAIGLALASAAGSTVAGLFPEDGRLRAGMAGAISLVGAAVAVVGLSLSNTVLVGVAFFIVIYLLSGFMYPFAQQILHDGVEASERATMLSAKSLSLQLGVLVTGLGLARIADATGIPQALWIGAVFLVVAAAFFLAIDRQGSEQESVMSEEAIPERSS